MHMYKTLDFGVVGKFACFSLRAEMHMSKTLDFGVVGKFACFRLRAEMHMYKTLDFGIVGQKSDLARGGELMHPIGSL